MRPAFLPYARQNIDDDDVAAVTAALRADLLTTGPLVESFEAAVADHTGADHVVACANGTAALHLALLATSPKAGSAVVVPAVTFAATANVAELSGCRVLIADVDPETGLATPQTIAEAMKGHEVHAILPVDLAGQATDRLGITSVADGLPVIYDSCHAFGTKLADGTAVGATPGAAAECFSFHPVKALAMGEGGAVATSDGRIAERARLLRNHGMVRAQDQFVSRSHAFDTDGSPNPWYYEISEPGYNYRVTDIQCALGLSQLRKIGRAAEHRVRLRRRYDARLRGWSSLILPLEPAAGCDPMLHLYPVRIDFPALGTTRARFMRELRERGIGSQVHYIPLHLHPYFAAKYGPRRLPGAEHYYARTLSLPFYFGMTERDVDRVVDALAEIAGLPTPPELDQLT